MGRKEEVDTRVIWVFMRRARCQKTGGDAGAKEGRTRVMYERGMYQYVVEGCGRR